MENKSHALTAGLFTIVLLAAAVLIGIWFNRDHVERVPYEIATKLSIPGLTPQAAVRYRGLDVGRVDEISFDPNAPGQILVHISVNPDTPITRSTYGTLGYQGVTGIAYVQLDDDGSNPVKKPSSKQQVARIEMRPSLLDTLQNKGLAILQQTEELSKRANTLLAPENQKAMLSAFDNVSAAASEIAKTTRKLEPALAQLPRLTAEAQLSLTSISKLTNGLQARGGPVDKFSSAAEQIGAMSDKLELEVVPLVHDARATMRLFDRTLENLNERPQSILFGSGKEPPGPGEAGFSAPAR